MTSDYPMISCLCPTRNRRAFLRQSLACFQAQDYPNRELVIVDDSDLPSDEFTGVSPALRYLWLSQSLTTGAKRNVAASLAQGDYLCLWDDDDYFGPQRLSLQVAPLLANEADVTALRMSLLLRTEDNTLWSPSPRVHARLFPYDVRTGTLLYHASYWRAGLTYDNSSRGEDVRYLAALLDCSARLTALTSPASYICVRHSGNTTADIAGIEPPEWEQVPLQQYLSEDVQQFYHGLAEGVADGH